MSKFKKEKYPTGGRIISEKWTFVYRDEYNVKFIGLEKLHPFDSSKWMNIFQILQNELKINKDVIYCPAEVTENTLLKVHTRDYIQSLKWSCRVASIAEIPALAVVPNYFLQNWYLKGMRFQVGGSLLAGKLAIDHGWSINIGGGFHHCSRNKGGGFCVYADITLLITEIFECYKDEIKKVMIIDLDAHQGNGYETDFKNDKRIYILDIYNGSIYPFDEAAKDAISYRIELDSYTGDGEYIETVKRGLDHSLYEFRPNLIVYNAGTDILDGDQLGKLCVSEKGIILRDEIVFTRAREKNIPIIMLTSGGYTRESAGVVAKSIINLANKQLISPVKLH